MRDEVDSKAFLLCLLGRLPIMLLIGLTGAILGSGLYLIITLASNRTPVYECETEYYIDFAEGRYEAKDYYNAYTWNDVMATDLILGRTMETLGDGYDRETVKNMITAVIMSDVRYLEVTVQGSDAAAVEAVSAATEISLEAFPEDKDEFDSITQIEKNPVTQVKKQFFTWRAFALGFLAAILLALFVFCVRFGLGECFYTKRELTERLGLAALGLSYDRGQEADGLLETQTRLALEAVVRERAVLVDVAPGAYAAHFAEAYPTLASRLDVMAYPIIDNICYDKIKATQGAILVIPFGAPCRNQALDVIDELRRRECPIAGAVLARADRRWMRAYYGGHCLQKEGTAR